MRTRLHFLVFALLFATPCFAQGIRVPISVTQQATIGTGTAAVNVVTIPASPVVAVCAHPANAVPCTNKATTYTDATLGTACNTSTQIVLDGTTTCVANLNAQNQGGVWVAPGYYDYTVTVSGTNFGPYYVTAISSTARTNLFIQSVAATTWTITHNFGDGNFNIQCFDTLGNLIFPTNVAKTTINIATVTWPASQAGTCTLIDVTNSSFTSNVPNAVLTNPTGSQTISGSYSFNVPGPVGFTGGGTLAGTFAGNRTDTGNNTHSGTETFNQLSGCQHVNANQSFAAALTAVGTNGCLVVDPGTFSVSANATIPAGVTLYVMTNGILSIATSVTLTINGPIVSAPQTIFTYNGTGVALITNLLPVIYQWFPGSDPGAQVNAAIAALSGRGVIWITSSSASSTLTFTTNPFVGRTNTDRIHLFFGDGTYQFNVPMSIVENTWIQGQGPRNTVMQAGSSGFVIQYCESTSSLPNPTGTCLANTAAQSIIVSDLTINGNSGNFSGSGCLLYQNFDLPSRVENVICQNFGSFGGFQFIETAAAAAGAGGSGRNLWAIQSTAGTAGGTISTAIPFTIDSVNHFACDKCFAQYAPAGVVIKNTQNLAPTEILFTDFENEGIAVNSGSTGVGLDLQANTNGVSVKGWSWLGPSSGSGTCLKTASSASNWDIQGFYSNRTGTTVFNINGNTYTPSNTFVHRFSDNVFQNNAGLEIWTGNTTPTDPTSAFMAFTNQTNCVLGGVTVGVVTYTTQCSGRYTGNGFYSTTGTACTNGELALSAGWGSTATVTAAAGLGQTCEWTITSSGTGQAANPTITDTLTNALVSSSTVCEARMVGGTGTSTLIDQTALSATAPVFTFGGTPVASSTYKVVRRCGP